MVLTSRRTRGLTMFQRKNNNIFAVISEYNPFHSGHRFLLEKTREKTGCKYCIVVMSGDFVQRGEPSIFDKYTRAEMALKNGADLVIELPVLFATSSAEGFAKGAVKTINALQCVDYLSFGSESGNIKELMDAAFLLNSNEFNDNFEIKNLLKNGYTYPRAIQEVFNSKYDSSVLFGSNNILAIEYIRCLLQLQSQIAPLTIKREDNEYTDTSLPNSKSFASALSIRNSINNNLTEYLNFIPNNILELYHTPRICGDDMSDIIYYSLINKNADELSKYSDVSEELAHKIVNNLKNYKNLSSFIDLLKHKNMTYSRISRALLHIMLNIKDNPVNIDPEYIRILGFKKEAAELLSIIKENSTLPLISKLKDAKESKLLNLDITSAHIYEQIRKTHLNEYTTPIIII